MKRVAVSWWFNLSTTWRAMTVIIAILAAGASGFAYLDNYVKKEELETHLADERELRNQIRTLAEVSAATTAQVKEIAEATKETRNDIRILLKQMLERPPARRK